MALPPPAPPPPSGQHLRSISHEGRFWDVYLEFEGEVRRADVCRAALLFSPADANDGEVPLRTTIVIVESSYEEAVRRAGDLEVHQLVAFLRSLLP